MGGHNYNTLVDALEAKQYSSGEKGITFILGEKDEKKVSYKELYSTACTFLYGLQSKGIQQGDELIFQIEDNESFLYTFWACLLGGIVPVPVTVGNNDEHRHKLLNIWRILKRPYLVCEHKTFLSLEKFTSEKSSENIFNEIKLKMVYIEDVKESEDVQGRIHRPSPTDTAFIQFSSGSTGDPKGVVLTHENLIANTEAIAHGAGINPEDIVLNWMPLTHDMGLIGFHLMTLLADAGQWIMSTALFVRHPTLWMDKTSQHRATVLYSPNFGYKHFLSFYSTGVQKDWDLSCVRVIFNGAEPISAELCNTFLRKLEEYGLKRTAMFTVYGLAEASVGVSFPPQGEEFKCVYIHRKSLNIGGAVVEVSREHRECVCFVEVGYPIDYCQVRICDENNQAVNDGVIGYIQIKGKNVTSGYYNNQEATARVMTADGWLNTEDLGFTKAGSLVITGRAKDIIFINGQNYYPHDIERIAEEVYGETLRYVAACGAFNKELQREEIILFVLFKKKLKEFIPIAAELKNIINNKTGLTIKEVIPVKNVPRTTSGKIQRHLLADSYISGEFCSIIQEMKELESENESMDQNVCTSITEKKLLEICCKVFDIDRIGVNDNFLELGGDSILLTKVHAEVEKQYPGKTTITDFFAYPAISKIAKFIERDQRILIPVLALPRDYFNQERNFQEKSDFKIVIPEEIFEKIYDFSKSEKIALEDIFLGIYIYMLALDSGNTRVTIQVMIDSYNHVMSLDLNLSEVSDFLEIFRLISNKRQNPSEAIIYPLQDLVFARMNKDDTSVIPFFYKKGLDKLKTSLLDTYDIVLELMEMNGRMLINFEYNKERLRKEKISQHIDKFSKLIEMITESISYNK